MCRGIVPPPLLLLLVFASTSVAVAYVVASTSTSSFCPLHRASWLWPLVLLFLILSFSALCQSVVALLWCVQRFSAVYVFVSVGFFLFQYYYYYNGTMILSILFVVVELNASRAPRAQKNISEITKSLQL